MTKIIRTLFILVLILVLLSACSQNRQTEQESSPSPTPVPYQEEDIVFALQAGFDQLSDLNYFSAHDHNGAPMDPENVHLEDSSLWLERDSAMFFSLTAPLRKGIGVHLRWKTSAERDLCQSFRISPALDSNGQDQQVCIYGFGGCAFGSFSFESVECGQEGVQQHSEGMLILENDRWLEMVLWLDKDDSGRVNIFSWDAEKPELYSATTALLPGYAGLSDFGFSLDNYGMTIAVDGFDLISEGIESYLWFNAPAFSSHHDEVMALYQYDFSEEAAVVSADSTAPGAEATSAANSQDTQSQEVTGLSDEEIIAGLFASLLQPEDLPQHLGLQAIREDAYDSLDDLRLTRTFLQEPSGSSGGLQITSEVTIHRSPMRNLNDLMQAVAFDINAENPRTNAPQAGDFSVSFFRSPFERYMASRGNISVDIYCRNILSGVDPWCTPENLAPIAGLMLDRMPAVDRPPLLALAIPEQHSDAWFDSFRMDDPLSMKIQWQTAASLPSMEMVLFHEDLQQTLYRINLLDMAGAEPGPREFQIRPGQQGDNENMPLGGYRLYVLAGDEIAFEMEVTRE